MMNDTEQLVYSCSLHFVSSLWMDEVGRPSGEEKNNLISEGLSSYTRRQLSSLSLPSSTSSSPPLSPPLQNHPSLPPSPETPGSSSWGLYGNIITARVIIRIIIVFCDLRRYVVSPSAGAWARIGTHWHRRITCYNVAMTAHMCIEFKCFGYKPARKVSLSIGGNKKHPA